MIKQVFFITSTVICFSGAGYAENSAANFSESILKTYRGIQKQEDLLPIFKGYMDSELRLFLTRNLNWENLKKQVSVSTEGEALFIASAKESATIEFINKKIWINHRPWSFDPLKSAPKSMMEIQEIISKTKKSAVNNVFERLFFERAEAVIMLVIGGVAAVVYIAAAIKTNNDCREDDNMPLPESSCIFRGGAWPFYQSKTKLVKIDCMVSDSRVERAQKFDGVVLTAENGEEISAENSAYAFIHSSKAKEKTSYRVAYNTGPYLFARELTRTHAPSVEIGSYQVNRSPSRPINTDPLFTEGLSVVEATKKLKHYIDMCNEEPAAVEKINEQGKQLIKASVKANAGARESLKKAAQ